jgi:hypothetical protein
MQNPSHPGRVPLGPRVRRTLAGFFGAATLLLISPVPAQYSYDPAAADEQGPPGIRYFGSVKDDSGAFIPGATILLDSQQSSFVFVTDEQGRFRGTLPMDSQVSSVTTKCWKAGFQFIRISKRLGPQGLKPTVQVDCVLHPANSG